MKLLINIEDSKIEESSKEINHKIKELRDAVHQLDKLLDVQITLESEKVDAKAPTASVEYLKRIENLRHYKTNALDSLLENVKNDLERHGIKKDETLFKEIVGSIRTSAINKYKIGYLLSILSDIVNQDKRL